MEKVSTPVQKRRLVNWSTRDILVTAVVGIVFGLFLTGANYVYLFLIAPFGPIVQWSWNGLWFIPPLFMVYVSRKPGSGFLASVIAGLVQIPFTPFAATAVLGGVIFGVIAELTLFIFTRYRSFGFVRMALVGLVSGVILVAALGSLYKIFALDALAVLLTLLATVVGCIVCAVLARVLADAVARTGVFSGMALVAHRGAEAEEEEA